MREVSGESKDDKHDDDDAVEIKLNSKCRFGSLTHFNRLIEEIWPYFW